MNNSKEAFDYSNYMTIEALEDDVVVTFPKSFMYGINGIGWSLYSNPIKLVKGDVLSAKYNLLYGDNVGMIIVAGKFNLKGNCLSLIFGDKASTQKDLSRYAKVLSSTFSENSGLQSIDNNFLPATTLADSCYSNMFEDCTSLTTAPELPATTLATRCYYSMFQGCTSLTAAPELPATILANSCYVNMFCNCKSLTTAPELPATTLEYACYSYMFQGCTSLTAAPELPATILANSCYVNMFRDCTKLNYIKMLATDISASSCLYSWVYGVASTGTFVKNSSMTTLPTGKNGIPSGWTVQNATS